MRFESRYLFIFILLFMSCLVYAQPPFQTGVGEDFLILETPIIEYHPQSSDWEFHIHVYNSSNLLKILPDGYGNVVCDYDLYNPQLGEHIIVGEIPSEDDEWAINIFGSNFSTNGQYSIIFDCKTTNLTIDKGGFFQYDFSVTQSGESPGVVRLLAYIVLLLSVIGIMSFFKSTHSRTDFKESKKKIVNSHKNMGETMVKGILTGLFQNSFIWLYFSGWLLVLILRQIIYEFGNVVVYEYFVLIANIYSLGLILVTVYMIGFLITYMRNMIGILTDNLWGVGE